MNYVPDEDDGLTPEEMQASMAAEYEEEQSSDAEDFNELEQSAAKPDDVDDDGLPAGPDPEEQSRCEAESGEEPSDDEDPSPEPPAPQPEPVGDVHKLFSEAFVLLRKQDNRINELEKSIKILETEQEGGKPFALAMQQFFESLNSLSRDALEQSQENRKHEHDGQRGDETGG